MARSIKTKFLVFILPLICVYAKGKTGNKHESEVRTRLKDIPKTFEVQGYDANAQFKKYSDQIQGVAMQENLDVVYKVQVDIQKSSKRRKRKQSRKRSKKYNVPLKKTSMKLSNFEVWLRKMAEETSLHKKNNPQNYENQEQPTTKGEKVITTTKQIHYKYKPIILKSKTNYTKYYVKPVRKRVITLGS